MVKGSYNNFAMCARRKHGRIPSGSKTKYGCAKKKHHKKAKVRKHHRSHKGRKHHKGCSR